MKKPSRKSRPARPLFNAAPLPETHLGAAVPEALAPEEPPPVPLPSGTGHNSARHDGWTPERRADFCHILSECGVVGKAAKAVGLSRRAAYALRKRDSGFAREWDAARHAARQALIDYATSHAFEGRLTLLFEQGKQIGERLRNTPMMVLGVVKRIRTKAIMEDPVIVAATRDFDHCMDLLEQGIAYPDPSGGDNPPPVTGDLAGWTLAEQRAFCDTLSDCGNVGEACKAIGKTRSTVYAARHHANGRAFAIAWDAALLMASELLIDLAMDLARTGAVDVARRHGVVKGHKRHISAEMQLRVAAMIEALLLPEPQDEGEDMAVISVSKV